MKIKLFKSDKNGKWYWHVTAKNGRVIAASQGYKSKKGAIKGLLALHKEAQGGLFIKV